MPRTTILTLIISFNITIANGAEIPSTTTSHFRINTLSKQIIDASNGDIKVYSYEGLLLCEKKYSNDALISRKGNAVLSKYQIYYENICQPKTTNSPFKNMTIDTSKSKRKSFFIFDFDLDKNINNSVYYIEESTIYSNKNGLAISTVKNNFIKWANLNKNSHHSTPTEEIDGVYATTKPNKLKGADLFNLKTQEVTDQIKSNSNINISSTINKTIDGKQYFSFETRCGVYYIPFAIDSGKRVYEAVFNPAASMLLYDSISENGNRTLISTQILFNTIKYRELNCN